jgi:hypothetical protein
MLPPAFDVESAEDAGFVQFDARHGLEYQIQAAWIALAGRGQVPKLHPLLVVGGHERVTG